MNASVSVKLARAFGPAAPAPRHLARFYFLGVTALALAALPALREVGALSGFFLFRYSLQWFALLSGAFVLALAQAGIAVALWTRAADWLGRVAQAVAAALSRLGWLNLALFALVWLGYVGVVIWRYGVHFNPLTVRIWLFWTAVGLGAMFLMASPLKLHPFWALAATGLIYGLGVHVLSYIPQVSGYPFSLSWSEASRFYYGSLLFSEQIYGQRIPLSPMHPSRYLLLGLPYLIPGSSLFFHRLWQAALWLVLSLAAGGALMRRLGLKKGAAWLGAIWAALFLLQGPVYYQLLVCVVIVLLGVKTQRFWQTLAVVLVASAWAGISRVNWIPVPAMLALALYLLEKPVSEGRGWLRYLAPPAAWTVAGLAAGFAAQETYVALSGWPDTSIFSSSFTSALLWYRLLPNPTYPPGVLPAILELTLPALLLVAMHWRRNRAAWHGLRILGFAGMILVLFAVGLVVSTKIGGGSNIHNLDAFIVMTAVLAAYLWAGRARGEGGVALPRFAPWLLTALLVILPVTWNLNVGNPFPQRDYARAAEDLSELQIVMDQVQEGREVLFITQRHLVTFGYITGVNMVPDYELLVLSELAISDNQAALEPFYADLREHRYAVIVSSVQNIILKDPLLNSFSEENNAWVEYVVKPIDRYYESRLTLNQQGVTLLFPRD